MATEPATKRQRRKAAKMEVAQISPEVRKLQEEIQALVIAKDERDDRRISEWVNGSENPDNRSYWTVQEFSKGPGGEPYLSLREYDRDGNVFRGFTGTRAEIDKLIADHQVTAQELPAVTEAEYYRQSLQAPREVEEIQRTKQALPSEAQASVEKAELIRQLREFAGARSELPYVQPEAAMAANVAQQLESGAKVIDLTQRYATGDSEVARKRHKAAVRNMKVALSVAGKHGQIEEGQGIAHGALKQNETLAVNQNFKRGLANGANVLRAAGNHQQHSVQTPRLSIGGEGLGGGI